jgi:hypothetical protein
MGLCWRGKDSENKGLLTNKVYKWVICVVYKEREFVDKSEYTAVVYMGPMSCCRNFTLVVII